MSGEEYGHTVSLSSHDLLALKAGLEVLDSELRRGHLSVPEGDVEHLENLLARLEPLVEAEQAAAITLTSAEAGLLAHYVERAMRLRGYVVGRPQANEWFVHLYRKLSAVARGQRGERRSRWRRWLVRRWRRLHR